MTEWQADEGGRKMEGRQLTIILEDIQASLPLTSPPYALIMSELHACQARLGRGRRHAVRQPACGPGATMTLDEEYSEATIRLYDVKRRKNIVRACVGKVTPQTPIIIMVGVRQCVKPMPYTIHTAPDGHFCSCIWA